MRMRKGFRLWNRKDMYSLQQKGSLTVESAFVLPLFLLGAVVLLSVLDLFRIQCILTTALSQSAKELGMYAYSVGEDSSSPVGKVSSAVCIAYGTSEVQKRLQGENLTGIVGKKNGFSLIQSGYRNGIVSLKAVYLYKSPFSLIPGRAVKVTAAASAQAWTGYQGSRYGDGGGAKEEMVYVTDFESVYHTSSECTHIHLSVSTVSRGQIKEQKNVYGDKYLPCDKCMKGHENGVLFYVSEKGNRYHSSKTCSGLIRRVRMVKQSEAETLRPCTRCG